MEYIKSNPLALKIVSKELKLEIGLIANGDALLLQVHSETLPMLLNTLIGVWLIQKC